MKKLLIIIYIIIFTALAYYVVTLFVNRNQEPEKIEIKSQTETNDEISTDATPPIIPRPDVEKTSDKQKNTTYTITQENCDNECTTIEGAEKKSYCNQVCGFTNATSSDETCDELNGLDKDYCLSDKAVEQQNLQKCTEIQDSGIEKQCTNRINEDFIDEVM